MGLLSKALNGSSDKAGVALKDRLLRLASKKTSSGSSAYTALSLLKGYGAFKSGACLELKEDVYTSYVSVGMGVARILLPSKYLTPGAQTFFEIENPESLSLNFFTPGMKLWVFPLDSRDPNLNLLLAAEEPGADFNPGRIAWVLEDTKAVFIPPLAPGTSESAAEPPESPLPANEFSLTLPEEDPAEKPSAEEIRSKISAYHEAHPQFQGIVPETPDTGKDDFTTRLRLKIGAMGEIVILPYGRALLLLPMFQDRELIAHRLSASLDTEILSCFEADNPEKALELIQPYL